MADFPATFDTIEEIEQLLPAANLVHIPAPAPPSPSMGSNADMSYVYDLLGKHFDDEATKADLRQVLLRYHSP